MDARDLIYYNATDSLTGDCFSSIVGEDLNGVDVGTWVLGGQCCIASQPSISS